jgi:hypothetical protein
MVIPKIDKHITEAYRNIRIAIFSVQESDFMDLQLLWRQIGDSKMSQILTPHLRNAIMSYAGNAHTYINELVQISDYPVTDAHMKFKIKKFQNAMNLVFDEHMREIDRNYFQRTDMLKVIKEHIGRIENVLEMKDESQTIQDIETDILNVTKSLKDLIQL